MEYAFKAINSTNLMAVAVKGVDTACIVVQKRVPVSVILTLSLIFSGFRFELSTYYHSKSHFFQDKLILADSVTSIYKLSPSIGCAMIGMVPDSKFQVNMNMNSLFPVAML